EVFIKNSGMESIKVVDNGRGIDYEDRTLLFERHATSKIDTAYELFEIRSLGFRGEALASIGAVAKVTLESMREDSTPFKIVYAGGKYDEDTVWHERRGTIIEIEDLFFKDRKSTRLNSSHVSSSYAVFCLKKKKKSGRQHVHVRRER